MSTIKSSNEHLTLNADGSSKDIKLQANASEKVIVKSDGKVGIGVTSPAVTLELSGNGGALRLPSGGELQFADSANKIYGHSSNNYLRFDTNSTERMRVTDNGLTFNGDTAAANALDDYEEGTWTPVLTDLSNNATMHSLSTGSYTKIGRVVTVTGNVRTSSLNSVSGNLYISGLPYGCAPGNGFHAAGAIANAENFSITAGNSIAIYMSANTTNLRIDIYDSTVGVTVMQASEWTSDGQIAISVTYFAA